MMRRTSRSLLTTPPELSTVIDYTSKKATGLIVVDPDRADELLHTLQGIQPDELAVVILGHDSQVEHAGSLGRRPAGQSPCCRDSV